MVREGFIEKIIYKSDESGYAVFTVESEEDGEEIFVGTLYGVGEGLYVIAEGEYVNHPQYDIQFKFTSCEIKLPDNVLGIERYLASGIIKGIGEVTAKKIVKKFKADSLRIIEEEPERLAEISGISERTARKIAVSYAEKREFQDVVLFLSEYGISVNLAMKIYNEYGDKVYDILRENPYKLAEDITGVGFKQADGIARRMGVEQDSVFRLRCALLYVLNSQGLEGHMYLPKDELIQMTVKITRDTSQDIEGIYGQSAYGYGEYASPSSTSAFEEVVEVLEEQIMELAINNKIVLKDIDGVPVIYNAVNYYVELNSAKRLVDLQLRYDMSEEELEDAIGKIEQEDNISLDPVQRQAVKSAITAGVAVVTGGPGTGKTTIIDVIIKYFSSQGMEIKLCAPTGRAAKRMTESTGWPAQTIHRLLEFSGAPEEGEYGKDEHGLHFGRNVDNPLECDAIIVDEVSMVDAYIFHSLLNAIVYGTRLILVGDVNQLPSVGAGNVLKDIISSDCFPVATLSKIFRQEDGSDIVYNAHRMNRGEHLNISNVNSKDFFFIRKNNATETIAEVQELIAKNLPNYYKLSSQEIQILCPMRKNEVGVENMNRRIQTLLNPAKPGKPEKEHSDVIFRKGDKVMQIKNNYEMEWKIYGVSKVGSGRGYVLDEGVGVFNGDMGIIIDINDYDEELTVLFDDGRESVYSYQALDQLEHAFAVTIHKSQGSGATRSLLKR